MDVKAELVLLIFTLNCVTLILLGQDLVRYRLCRDRSADYPACKTTEVTTTTHTPILIDNTITTTTTTTSTATTAATRIAVNNNTATIITADTGPITSTIITTTAITPTPSTTTTTTADTTINNNTVPFITTNTAPITTSTTTTTTTTSSILINLLTLLRPQSSPLPPPHQHQSSPQQLPHQLSPPASPPPKSKSEKAPLTPSSLPPSPQQPQSSPPQLPHQLRPLTPPPPPPLPPPMSKSEKTPLTPSSPSSPQQPYSSPPQLPHQLLRPLPPPPPRSPPLPPPMNKSEKTPLTPSSPPSPSGSVDMNINSGRYLDADDGEEDDLTREVHTCGLIIIGTFVSTSVASSQVLGRWIDTWSCRTLTLFPAAGVVAWAVCGLLVSSVPSLPLYLWLVGAALGGSSGGFVTLKAVATIYAVQASPRWDSTVRLAFLQAATSLGILIAYLCLYFLIYPDPLLSMTNIFLGITVLGTLNVCFAVIFLSDKPPTSPATTTITTTVTTVTTPPRDLPRTPISARSSRRSSMVRRFTREEREEDVNKEEGRKDEDVDSEDDNDKYGKEDVGQMGKYETEVKEILERNDRYDENEKKEEVVTTSSIIKVKRDVDVGTRTYSSFPVDIVVTPPEGEMHENVTDTAVNTQRSKRKRKLGIIHNFVPDLSAWNEEEERSLEPGSKHASPSGDHGTWLYPKSPIPIIISSEDGRSTYGTPPEHPSQPPNLCETPSSQAPSCNPPCTSLEVTPAGASASGQESGVSTPLQQPLQQSEVRAGTLCYDLLRPQENRHYYERPRHQITKLSSSAPSTFSSLTEANSDAASAPRRQALLEETQTVNTLRVSDSQDDMLMTPNVLLTPASSFGSMLGCEGSNSSSSSSSSSSGESRDVMRGDEGGSLYDCASLGDMSQDGTKPAWTRRYSYASTSSRRPSSILTIQSTDMGDVGERGERRSLALLTVASESSGEGVCCAGGGGAGRCLACVAGRLLCRPVSVTFRRRAAGLRGVVVADVVAAFFVSVVAAGIWEVTPLYLAAKLGWSLPDWVSYQACRSGLSVGALMVLLPLLRLRFSLRDTTLGVLGGVSSLLSSVCLSALSASSSVIPLALLFGPLALYLDVASAAILVRLVSANELGGVLLCLGSVQQAGHATGWLAFHYLFPLLLRARMPGVSYLATGLLLIVPSTIFGVLYFSLGLRSRSRAPNGSARLTPPSPAGAAPQRRSSGLQTRMYS